MSPHERTVKQTMTLAANEPKTWCASERNWVSTCIKPRAALSLRPTFYPSTSPCGWNGNEQPSDKISVYGLHINKYPTETAGQYYESGKSKYHHVYYRLQHSPSTRIRSQTYAANRNNNEGTTTLQATGWPLTWDSFDPCTCKVMTIDCYSAFLLETNPQKMTAKPSQIW